MGKKILGILTVVMILMSIMPLQLIYATDDTTIASGECGDNVTWSLDSDGTLTISGTGAMYNSSSVSESPWADYQEQVKQVVFEGTITSIGTRAFEYNTNLTSIELPSSVTSISLRAFAECTNLKTVSFPNGLISIGEVAFYNCTSLESVTLADSSVLYIYRGAFGECASLESITIKTFYCSISDYSDVFPENAIICSYQYSNAYYYARYYGRTFKDLNTNEESTTTVTVSDYLNALPTSGLEALGPTTHTGRSLSRNQLVGYTTSFAYESDTTNENYIAIKEKVEELTEDCTTEKEKAYAIARWVYLNVTYTSGLGASASMNSIYTLYGLMKGNCSAMTLLTNYMLYLCGIPTATVSNLTHEWTAAYVDGEWKYIDTTAGGYVGYCFKKVNQISFAYDGVVYVINDPNDGAYIAGIAMESSEIDEIESFTIPTNSFTTGIYSNVFSDSIELIADLGTIGEEYIRNSGRECLKVTDTQIIGNLEHTEEEKVEDNQKITYCSKCGEIFSSVEVESYLKGDVNGDGDVTLVDYILILKHVRKAKLLSGDALERADVNEDGNVTLLDYILVLKHVTKVKLLF